MEPDAALGTAQSDHLTEEIDGLEVRAGGNDALIAVRRSVDAILDQAKGITLGPRSRARAVVVIDVPDGLRSLSQRNLSGCWISDTRKSCDAQCGNEEAHCFTSK